MLKKTVLSFLLSSSLVLIPFTSNAFSEGFEDLINNSNSNSEEQPKVDPNKNTTIPPMFLS